MLKMSDAKRINKEKWYHFFDRATMKSFSSVLESGLLSGNYFITSEDMSLWSPPNRKFHVRQFIPETGAIKCWTDKHFATRQGAMDFIKELRKGGE